MEDIIIEDEDQYEHVPEKPVAMFNPITFVVEFFALYGWYVLGAVAVSIYAYSKLRPRLDKWRQSQRDAEYHKDPDKALARMEAIQRAREKQQRLLLEASERAKQLQLEREEKKRQENAERLEKYGTAAGQRLGTKEDDGYLPLSGGSMSSYKAPKRSACSKGGCGR